MRPNSLGLGDFNNDGKLDVVSANYDGAGGASSISVLLGNESGGFAPASTTSPVTSPQSVAVGDVNGDSRLDLAIVSSAPTMGLGSVSMLFGDGAGVFGAPTTYTAGQTSLFGTLVNLGGDNKRTFSSPTKIPTISRYASTMETVRLPRQVVFQ